MPSKDWNGTTTYEHGKIVDWNGTTSNILGKGWDWNGTTSTLFYKAWDGELLDGADEFEDITGGWNGNEYTNETWMQVITQDGSGLYSTGSPWGRTGTVKKVDITNYNKIVAEIEYPNGIYTLSTRFGIMSDKSKAILSNLVKSVSEDNYTATTVKSRTYTLDISSHTGSYYIAFVSTTNKNYPFRIKKITMS